MNIDALHRLILDATLQEFGIRGLKQAEKDHLNRVWHRLRPWPDALRGLRRLKSKFVITTLSNGNVALLTNMAKHSGLPWDRILSAELFRHNTSPTARPTWEQRRCSESSHARC